MKTTAEMIEVMAAFERGEVIECLVLDTEDVWSKLNNPSWNWVDCDYRTKPREPRVIWVNEYAAEHCCHDSKEQAISEAGTSAKRTAVKYQEVIE